MWSEGVKLTEKDELENVDKAVISGTQRVSASVLHVYYEASGTIEFGLTTFRVFFFSLYLSSVPALRILQKAGCNHSMPC